MSVRTQRILRFCLSFVLISVMLLTMFLPTASATGAAPVDLGTVELTGRLNGGVFELTPQQMENLFDLDGGIYPGGSWKQTVHVKNECSRPMEIAILSVTNQGEDTTLFDALTSTVMVDGEEVYSGSYGAGSEETPMTKSFRIQGGDTLDFEITVRLDAAATNEFQGKPLDSTWLFGAFYYYPSSSDYSRYTVYYVDEEGNELHEKKVANAKIGSTVTEQAVEIEGYTPDAPEKSIVIQRTPKKNEITFIYTPVIEPVSPEEPPADPTIDPTLDPEDKPAGVKTGVDLEDNLGIVQLLIFCMLVLTLLTAVVIRKLFLQKMITSDSRCKEDERNHE